MSDEAITTAPRVLVVEDDQKLAWLLCRALREEGLQAEPSFAGDVALRLLLEERFAAVVLDVGLPGLDGLAVCGALRSAGLTIPVIMLSARGDAEDVMQGRLAGASDYLLKPFSLTELSVRLNELVDMSAAPGPRVWKPHRALS